MLLRDWIVDHNYTQGQFAEAVGYGRTYFGLMLTGKRRMSTQFARRVSAFTLGEISEATLLDGSALGDGGVRRRVRRKGIPNKVLPKNAISFL